MVVASLCFRSACKEDLDNALKDSIFILKQLDYSLSISRARARNLIVKYLFRLLAVTFKIVAKVREIAERSGKLERTSLSPR